MRLASMHLWPDNELHHELDDDCPCAPTIYPTMVGWLILHGPLKEQITVMEDGSIEIDGTVYQGMETAPKILTHTRFEPPVL